jgi:DNA polymerase III subunit delta
MEPSAVFSITRASMAEQRFTFIGGSDDFIVGRMGRERFEAVADGLDEFSREVISGFAGTVAEVEAAVNRCREAVQTISMFGGRRVVWLKDVNFLADSVTGRAEGTLTQVEALQELLAAINPSEVTVMITAAPVDRRRSFAKWCEAHADYTFVGSDEKKGGPPPSLELAAAECHALGVSIEPDALELLIAKIEGNTRLLVEELRKLAAYLDDGESVIRSEHVLELVANFGSGDFFEAAEAFFAGDLKWTLEAIRRHFFAGNDARPLLSSLQNRNRLLIQVRALADAGEVRVGARGIDKGSFDKAAGTHAGAFAGLKEKSNFNVFTQNPWYLGKLIGTRELPPLRKLIDWQREFIRAFEELLSRPEEQEEIARGLAVRCLS